MPKTRPATRFLDWLDQVPPFLVYALSRHPRHPSKKELAFDCCASPRTMTRLSNRISWRNWRVWQLDRFLAACGVDIVNRKELREYLRQTRRSKQPYPHLSKQEREQLANLARRWREARRLNASA